MSKLIACLLLFGSFLISTQINAQITVDGNPADWPAVLADHVTYPISSYVPNPFGNDVVDNQKQKMILPMQPRVVRWQIIFYRRQNFQ